MVMNSLLTSVTERGPMGRRTLFRSLRAPAAAAAALAVGLASSGALRALPAAADAEYYDDDPIIWVNVNGTQTGVRVHLGWLLRANALVDRQTTRDSISASVKQGKNGAATITVTATVVTRDQSSLSTRLRIELLPPAAASSDWSYGTANKVMAASLAV